MLRTKRLTLRPALMSDLHDFNGFMSDPRAMAYWSTAPHPDLETSRAQLAQMVAAEPPITYFMFEHQDRVIGMGGMHHGNEVGFMLHPEYWRKGFVTEAMTAILDHIWASTNETFVHADADPENAASVGFLKSLGFHETHRAKNTFCIDGVWSDSVYFALPRPQ